MKKNYPISSRDKRPLHIQAISALTDMIYSGELPTGEKLPPEGELAELLGISRSTLREALGHLENYGMITRQQGRGTFVSAPQGMNFHVGLERLEPFRFVAEQANKDHEVVERSVRYYQDAPEVQAELNIPEPTKFHHVEVVESVDGNRCMFIEDFLIADNYDQEQVKNYKGSMLTYLVEQRKPSLSFSQTKLYAVGASEKAARKLDIEVGQPILHLRDTYFDAVGTLLGIGYLYLVTNHFYYYITRRVMPQY